MIKEKIIKLWAKWNRQYRVVMYDEEDLSQERIFRTKPIKTALIFISSGLFIIGATTAIIFFTPFVRKNIPGYQNSPELEKQALAITESKAEVEQEAAAVQEYIQSAKKVFSDASVNVDDIPDIEAENATNISLEVGSHAHEHDPVWGERTDLNVPAGEAPESWAQEDIASPYMSLTSPIDGLIRISKPFSAERYHFGVDLVAERNSLIRSIADGIVIFSDYSNQNGHIIGIFHRQYNLVSFYKHNKRILKYVGDYAFAGEPVAVIGNTGDNSDGPHLHLELWQDNMPINPEKHIKFN